MSYLLQPISDFAFLKYANSYTHWNTLPQFYYCNNHQFGCLQCHQNHHQLIITLLQIKMLWQSSGLIQKHFVFRKVWITVSFKYTQTQSPQNDINPYKKKILKETVVKSDILTPSLRHFGADQAFSVNSYGSWASCSPWQRTGKALRASKC